jgi:hypothetical protein
MTDLLAIPVGDAEVIHKLIETKAVLPVADEAKGKIVVSRTPRTTCDHQGQKLLYPHIEVTHAVIERMKAS